MSGLYRIATSLAAAMADSAIRALLLGLCAGFVICIARLRGASLRLWVWTMVLAAAIALPPIGAISPGGMWSLSIPLPPQAIAGDHFESGSLAGPEGATGQSAVVTPTGRPPATTVTPSQSRTPGRISLTALAVAAYFAVAIGLFARIVLGWATTTRARRRSMVVRDHGLVTRSQQYSAAAGLARAPRVVELPDVRVPITLGVVDPIIALPASWREWNTTMLDAVLVHELSHVARRDALTQVVALGYRAVCWFSPFSWWLHHHIVNLGEQASDDAVLASGVNRVTYAETLLAFFHTVDGRAARADWGVAMAQGHRAERRIERVLAWKAGTGRVSRAAALIVTIVAAPIVLIAAGSRATLVPVELPALGVAPAIAYVEQPSLSAPTWVADVPAASARPAPVKPEPAAAEAVPASVVQTQTQPSVEPTPSQDFRASMARPLAASRMIALVFRPQLMSPEDLARATRLVSVAVRDMFVRADVGLDVFHVVSVQVVGADVETIQEFTSDLDLIDAALSQVAARGSRPSGLTDVDALTRVCRDLEVHAPVELTADERTAKLIGASRTTALDAKAVLYFTAGAAGASNPEGLRNAVMACTRANTLVFAVASPFSVGPVGDRYATSLYAPKSPSPAISFNIVQHQTGAPVSLTQSTSTIDYGYASVTIRNDSPKRIRSVTIAALVWPNDPPTKSPEIFSRVGPVSTIEPGRSLEIASQLIDADMLNTLLIHGARAEVGVIGVEFVDGTTWTYDLAAKGHFERDR